LSDGINDCIILHKGITRKVICTFEIDHHGPGTHLACSPAVEAYVMPNGGLGFKMATL